MQNLGYILLDIANEIKQCIYELIQLQLTTVQWYDLLEYAKKLKNPSKNRTMTQNKYSWVLQTQLGNKLGIPVEDIHKEMLRKYGQREMISILSSIDPEGYFKYYEKIGTGIVKGKEFTHYYVYKESHNMNTKEFTILMDGIISDCEENGIATLTNEQIKAMRLI